MNYAKGLVMRFYKNAVDQSYNSYGCHMESVLLMYLPPGYDSRNSTLYAEVEPCGVGEPRVFALNSYASLFFNPALLPLRHKKKAPAPRIARPPITAPTAIPAFAPVDNPPPPPEACPGVEDADRLVLEAALPDELGVGALKSSDVTLKQGT